SSSMILRKCRTENPASSAALGISRNVLFTAHPSVDFIVAPFRRNYEHGGCLFVGHEGITVICRRNEVLFDRAGADPAKQVHHRTGLVVGPTRARSSERLLTDDGAGRFVIYVE